MQSAKRKTKRKIKILILAAGLFFALGIQAAEAAELKLAGSTEPAVGGGWPVEVWLNPEGEELNVVSGQIIFPAGHLRVKRIRHGDSVVPFWVAAPAVSAKGQIDFAGVIPGGFSGVLQPFNQEPKSGKLFVIDFEVTAVGSGELRFAAARALLNDGRGTEAAVDAPPLAFAVREVLSGAAAPPDDLPPPDVSPPEPFSIHLARHPSVFNGDWFAAFTAQDKESGVVGYAAAESRQSAGNYRSLAWREASSPYRLRDQSLRSFVYIKAVDQAGNETVAVLKPPAGKSRFTLSLLLLGFGIIVLLGILILWRFARRRFY